MNRINIYRLAIILAILSIAYFGYNSYVTSKTSDLAIVPDSIVFKRGCYNPDSLCLKIVYRFPVVQGLGSSRIEKIIVTDYLDRVQCKKVKYRYPFLKESLVSNALMYDTAFVEYVKQFGSQSRWFIDINYKPIFKTKRFLTIRYRLNSYLGGAHNMFEYQYLNIDLKKAQKIELTDLFADVNRFRTLVQKFFREQLINSTADETKYWTTTNEKFILPREFAITANGLLLHYNEYEISSYSHGDIQLLIPYDDLKDILVERYRDEL